MVECSEYYLIYYDHSDEANKSLKQYIDNRIGNSKTYIEKGEYLL